MEVTVHQQVLAGAFIVAVVMGATVSKTQFCTLGAVSDWVNMGDLGRLRAWVLAMAIAIAGVTVLELLGILNLSEATFPPYRTSMFNPLRYVLGGLLFGIGMTLASGCGNKTLIRLGGGNLKSFVVLLVMSGFAYQMMWGNAYAHWFEPWLASASIDLMQYGLASQSVSDVVIGVTGLSATPMIKAAIGLVIVGLLLLWVIRSTEFRSNHDQLLSGIVVGMAVLAGWCLTGGPLGQAWKEYAEFSDVMPSRVQVQSLTFISPLGDTVHFLLDAGGHTWLNFGGMVVVGVIIGAVIETVSARKFRIEWFSSVSDGIRHVCGAALMGVGGVLAMGCTLGQGVTGASTLAIGAMLAVCAMMSGAALTMKYQYWRMLQEDV
jgi:uncharacterized membrane protein YedE/YeeE